MLATPAEILQRLDEATEYIRSRITLQPQLAVVAGSGLGALGTILTDVVEIPYGELPHMPLTGVIGHAGKLVIGNLEGLPTAVLSGRVHAYEGWRPDEVVFGVRMLGRLGVGNVLLTNAAGGITEGLIPGTLVRIRDQINMTGMNPLRGHNVDALGPRFPDMSQIYDLELGQKLDETAQSLGIELKAGIYAAMSGPSYETPAEITMLRTIGADVVGMSTVPEAIALRHMGVRVTGISVVSNYAAGVSDELLDHDDVKKTALTAGPKLLRLVQGFASSLT